MTRDFILVNIFIAAKWICFNWLWFNCLWCDFPPIDSFVDWFLYSDDNRFVAKFNCGTFLCNTFSWKDILLNGFWWHFNDCIAMMRILSSSWLCLIWWWFKRHTINHVIVVYINWCSIISKKSWGKKVCIHLYPIVSRIDLMPFLSLALMMICPIISSYYPHCPHIILILFSYYPHIKHYSFNGFFVWFTKWIQK